MIRFSLLSTYSRSCCDVLWVSARIFAFSDRIGRWAAAAAGAQTAQVLARAAEAEAEAASTSVTGPPPAQETESKAHTAVEAAGATGLPPAAG